ncbi:MAG: hypothetical protein R3C27_07335 [Hyphomonadaceae bacterium]
MSLPFTGLIRVISVIVFVGSATALVLGLVSSAMAIFGLGNGLSFLGSGSIGTMLLAATSYQLCRLNEAKEPTDDQAVLLMAAIAELKAARETQAAPDQDAQP